MFLSKYTDLFIPMAQENTYLYAHFRTAVHGYDKFISNPYFVSVIAQAVKNPIQPRKSRHQPRREHYQTGSVK